MIKQCVCEYCGEIFTDNKENDYKETCAKHEINHLNLEDLFNSNLETTIRKIKDDEEDIDIKVSKQTVSLIYDSYYGKEIIYEVKGLVFKNGLNSHEFNIQFKVGYDEKENIPTLEEIERKIKEKVIIPNFEKRYEGIFWFEDYMGGIGGNTYKIGEVDINTIYNAFKGKKIKIEVLE